MTTKTNTLTEQILAVVKSNAKRGVTVPQIVQKLEKKFPFGLNNDFGGFNRQTVSGRVTAMYNEFKLETNGTRVNPTTGRTTTVYTTMGTSY